MNNVDSDLQQKLSRINKQKEELVQRQTQLENDLNQVRLVAEKRRDKKAKYEHQYNKISSVPILSIQSKKKYVQARDKNYATEQEVSEKRQILDQCRNHIRVLSKMIMAQQTEQTQLNEKREHSMNIIRSIVEQSLYLKEGRIYWTDFDEHQQVVLTYALQLMNMVKQYPTNTFDINNEWMQTFKLACLEYGDTVECGDKRWDTAIMKIDFECEQCQIPQSAWPFLCNNQLCCELCYMTQPSETHIIHESKMKKLIGSIFHLNRIE
ncbi:hypothetical protein BDB01DRAFT_713397 [Pilobolus umbonatus]|nr:hypothetical protein BDB01DRAFT_713397 [Pilobolus umbonatus]